MDPNPYLLGHILWCNVCSDMWGCSHAMCIFSLKDDDSPMITLDNYPEAWSVNPYQVNPPSPSCAAYERQKLIWGDGK